MPKGLLAMSSQRFSLVVPAHEANEALVTALGSILGQTEYPTEVVVADDSLGGSVSDLLSESQTVAELSSRTKFMVVRTGGMRGPAVARNLAVQASSGHVVSFLDSDDVLLPGHVALHRQSNLPRGRILSSRLIEADEQMRRVRVSNWVVPPVEAQWPAILRGNFVAGPSSLLRSDYLDWGGQRDDCVEDWDLWIRALHSGGVVKSLSRPTYVYIRRAKSRSHEPQTFVRLANTLANAADMCSDRKSRAALRKTQREIATLQAWHSASNVRDRIMLLPRSVMLRLGRKWVVDRLRARPTRNREFGTVADHGS